jgi:hypothetical protein
LPENRGASTAANAPAGLDTRTMMTYGKKNAQSPVANDC